MVKHKRNESLRHKKGAGPPKELNRVSKIVIAKSLEKMYQLTRTLAIKLTRMGNYVSKNTVHRYLKQDNLKTHGQRSILIYFAKFGRRDAR